MVGENTWATCFLHQQTAECKGVVPYNLCIKTMSWAAGQKQVFQIAGH